MMKYIFVLLLSLYTPSVFAGSGGYIGHHDNRRYGSLSEPGYNGIVKLTLDRGRLCTGGFVSKNIVITNNHCAVLCKNGCVAEFWNGSGYDTTNLTPVAYHKNSELRDGTDWALLYSEKENRFYNSVAPFSSPGPVLRGGFGLLRIIEDNEVPFLKYLYNKTVKEQTGFCKQTSKNSYDVIACINDIFDKRLKEINMQPVFQDSNRFKVQDCNIYGDYKNGLKYITTDCDSAGGDSGAPFLRDGQIVGLNNAGKQDIFGDSDINAVGIKTENFYVYVQDFVKKYQNGKPSEQTIVPWGGSIKTENNDDKLYLDSGLVSPSEENFDQLLQTFECD